MARLRRKRPVRSGWRERRFARDQWRYWATRAKEAERELAEMKAEDRAEFDAQRGAA